MATLTKKKLKKQSKVVDYIVVLINNHNPSIYYGYDDQLVKKIESKLPEKIEDVERDYPSKVANFSDNSTIQEINLDKYLREIDDALTLELKIANKPVIVCGVQRSIGHFKKLSKNGKKIIGYVEGDYHHKTPAELFEKIKPVLLQIRKN